MKVTCGGVPGTQPCRYYHYKSYRGQMTSRMCMKRTADKRYKDRKTTTGRRIPVQNFLYAYKRTDPGFACPWARPIKDKKE